MRRQGARCGQFEVSKPLGTGLFVRVCVCVRVRGCDQGMRGSGSAPPPLCFQQAGEDLMRAPLLCTGRTKKIWAHLRPGGTND
jgi:hypothetical protein